VLVVLCSVQDSLSAKLPPAETSRRSRAQKATEQALGVATDSRSDCMRPSRDVEGMVGLETPQDRERLQRVTAVFLEVRGPAPPHRLVRASTASLLRRGVAAVFLMEKLPCPFS